MRATVLVDNIGTDGLKAEWGLAVYIEYGDRRILLDTGASGKFLDNAKVLGIDLSRVEAAVLSHAHFDHADGMETFFKVNDKAFFYLREGAGEDCYKNLGFFKKYIGMPRRILKKYPDRIRFAGGDLELFPGVWLIPHKTPDLGLLGKREKMVRRKGLRFVDDDFSHEQSLVFETDKGLVIFNSCCHGGAANIIREVSATFPGKPVCALIGGFHLYNKTEAEVKELAAKIRETGIGYLCTGHCTKEKAYGILEKELGDRMHQLHTGLVMEF